MSELDGIILLLAKFKFGGKELGLISEDGVAWGGNDPEYLEITAAQTRSVVKKVLKKAGTEKLTFKLIQLKVQNLVDTIGGTADVSGSKWDAPAVSVLKEGPLEIETVTGQVITADKVTLGGKFGGTIGADDPLGVNFTLTVINDGVNSPFSIDNTAPEEG